MDNKVIVGVVAVLALIVGIFGYSVIKSNNNLAATIGPAAALSNMNLLNALHDLAYDVQNVRTPLAGLVYKQQTSVGWSILNAADAASSTIINLSGTATVGDLCLTQPANATTSELVSFRCRVSATGTGNASATLEVSLASTTAVSIGTLDMNVWVFPTASFRAPASLTVSTSTGAGN